MSSFPATTTVWFLGHSSGIIFVVVVSTGCMVVNISEVVVGAEAVVEIWEVLLQ